MSITSRPKEAASGHGRTSGTVIAAGSAERVNAGVGGDSGFDQCSIHGDEPVRPGTLLIVYCGAALITATLACRIVGAMRAARGAARVGRARTAGMIPDHARAEEIACAIVYAAAFLPGRVRCLEQSIALFVVLRRARFPARLRFGAHAHPFLAHAWVELDGNPLNEVEETMNRIVPFPDFIS